MTPKAELSKTETQEALRILLEKQSPLLTGMACKAVWSNFAPTQTLKT